MEQDSGSQTSILFHVQMSIFVTPYGACLQAQNLRGFAPFCYSHSFVSKMSFSPKQILAPTVCKLGVNRFSHDEKVLEED